MPQSTPSPAQLFYNCISLEFLQPWEFESNLRKIKELGLGNMTMLNIAFHIGNSEAERRRWKEEFPSLAERIDATPKFEDRPEHGMAVVLNLPLDFHLHYMQRCRELGLSLLCYPFKRTTIPPEEAAQLTAAGEGIVVFDMVMAEDLSKMGNGYTLEQLAALHARQYSQETVPDYEPFPLPDSYDKLNLQTMHDWLLTPYGGEMKKLRAMGGAPYLMAIEASAQIHLTLEAGADIPVLELVPHDPIGGLAAVRGAAKAYRAPFWGVHTALGYYQAPTNQWTAERLQIGYNLFYAGGCTLFSEPNAALQNVGLCSGFFSIKASPPLRLGDKEIRGFDDPVCVRSREVLTEHHRFTQFHRRPDGGPRVKLGFVMGHLDGYIGSEQEYVWCVADEAFKAGAPETTWRHFERMYDTEAWYTPPRKYYWQADPAKPLFFGTPPCGQLDIVPLTAPLEILQSYNALVFLGWNTMTPENYGKLKEYVRKGGHLVMSVPQLSAQLRRDQELQLINGGDVSELFGCHVHGPGKQVEEIILSEQSLRDRYVLPVGTLYLEGAPLALVEVNGGRTLAHERHGDAPLLVENRYGAGTSWLLTTWTYPGHRLDAFITDLLRTIAEGEQQDDVALAGERVDYAIYDAQASGGEKLSTIYLTNKNIYGQPQYPQLIVHGRRIPIRVGGYRMRVAWLYDEELLISPDSRFVQVDDVERQGDDYRVRLRAEPGEHHIQIEARTDLIRHVEFNGARLELGRDREGAAGLTCRLEAENNLVVVIRPCPRPAP